MSCKDQSYRGHLKQKPIRLRSKKREMGKRSRERIQVEIHRTTGEEGRKEGIGGDFTRKENQKWK